MSSFINIIKYIHENIKSIKEIKNYIEKFIPYYKFRATKLDEISSWFPLILNCIENKQSFKIAFSEKIEYIFDGVKEKEKFHKLYFYFTSNELKLSDSSKYELRLDKKKEYKYCIDKSKKENNVFKFYYFVREVLKKEKLKESLLETINKESSKKDSLSKSERYKYFKISNLFENNNLGSIGKFWMIIYNMNDRAVQSLYKLLTTNEQKIFNLFLQFYNNDKIDDIDKVIGFSKSLTFYNDNLVIINLEADELYVDQKIKKFQKHKDEKDKKDLEIFNNTILKVEKQKFEKINYFTSEIDQNEIIKIYDDLIQKIEGIFIADKATKEKLELEKKFTDLLKKIEKIPTKLPNIINYKKSLIEQIKLSNQNDEYDKEVYNMYYNKYEQLKKTNENIGKNITFSNNVIKWPILMPDKNLEKSKTTLFIELLIWYSKIKNIIDNIKTNNKNKDNKFKYILELQEFEEMKYASNLIISTEELTEDEFIMIYSTLNSHFILKMIKNKLEQYLFNIKYEINKILENNLLLTDKNDIINKNDYCNILEKEKEIGNEFLIQIPKFNSKDIVFLYMQFGSKNKNKEYEPYEGPILKQIKYSRILDVLLGNKINILNDNFGKKTAEESAKEIIYTLSKNTFQIKESFDEFTTDIDNKIINLKTEPIDTRKEKDFINIFKMTLDIAKKIDKINNSNDNVKLLFDDTIFFTDQKWYQNLDYTTKYPHLIYILNRYDGIYEDIIEIIKIKKTNFKTDENTIPFWLIILRLLSNIHNIEVDYNQENNELSKTISDKESIYLQNKIIKIAYENNIQVDTQWINLCLKNLINNSLFSNKSRHIYNYIFSQIQSLPKLNEEISQIIEDNIMKFNNKIIDYQFENKIKDIYDLDLSEDDDIIKIINNPKDFYKYEIQKKYNKIMKDLINSQHFKKLNDFFQAEVDQNKNNENSNNNNEDNVDNENNEDNEDSDNYINNDIKNKTFSSFCEN